MNRFFRAFTLTSVVVTSIITQLTQNVFGATITVNRGQVIPEYESVFQPFSYLPTIRDFTIQVNLPYGETLESLDLTFDVPDVRGVTEVTKTIPSPPTPADIGTVPYVPVDLSGANQHTFKIDNFALWQTGENKLRITANTSTGSDSIDVLFKFNPEFAISGIGREGDGRFGSSFSIPNIPIYASDCRFAICTDLDQDGLLDLWEEMALQQLSPIAELDENEEMIERWRYRKLIQESGGLDPFVEPINKLNLFTRITPVSSKETGEEYILFLNSVTFTRDYGSPIFDLDPHTGDTERLKIAWKVDEDRDEIFLDRLWTRGHKKNRPKKFTPIESELEDIELERGLVRFYIEEDKHGTWPSKNSCESKSRRPYDCGWDAENDLSLDPNGTDGIFRPDSYNVGEPYGGLPGKYGWALIDDLTAYGFPGEAIWSEKRSYPYSSSPYDGVFCGGLKCEGSSPPVYERVGNSDIPDEFEHISRANWPIPFSFINYELISHNSELSPPGEIKNSGFELGNFTNWSTLGNTSIQTSDFGKEPSEGNFQALLSTSGSSFSSMALETFLELEPNSLNNFGNGSLVYGSALKQTFTANAGQTVSFDWNFLTDQKALDDNQHFAFVSINPFLELADNSSPLLFDSLTPFNLETDWQTFSFQVAETGTYTLALGIMSAGNSLNSSGLLIDSVSRVPEPSSIFGLMGMGALSGVLKANSRRKSLKN